MGQQNDAYSYVTPGEQGRGGWATGGAAPRDVSYGAGGGGGGGYYGGGGGDGGDDGKDAQGGAGGSGYVNPAYASGTTMASPERTQPALNTDSAYASGVAVGGAGGTSAGSNRAGGPGLVVISWDGAAW